tara:strand:- start:2302 stop:3054 length:753 start_codon:yes stop_codon:yes gene_type:complete
MFLFNKFWDDSIQVIYLGYNAPDFKLPMNCQFISLGPDDNLKNWSNDLKNYFLSIDDDYFIMTTDDSFLVDYTNAHLYTKMLKYLETTDNNVGRVGLERDLVTRPHHYYDSIEDTELVLASNLAANRISCRWSIWKREYILKLLTPSRTPWTFESEGTRQSVNDGYDIISPALLDPEAPPDNAIIYNTNCIWRNWWKEYNRLNFHSSAHARNAKGLDASIIADMKSKNIIPKNSECGMIIDKQWHKIGNV